MGSSSVRDCVQCGKSFQPGKTTPYQIYCNHACRRTASNRRRYGPLTEREEIHCAYCDKLFRPKKCSPPNTSLCSSKCRKKRGWQIKKANKVKGLVSRAERVKQGSKYGCSNCQACGRLIMIPCYCYDCVRPGQRTLEPASWRLGRTGRAA